MKNKILTSFVIALVITLSGCASIPRDDKIPTPSQSVINPDATSEAKASIAAESTKSAKPTDATSPAPTSSRAEVIWSDYDPGTQGEIDRMTLAGDCLGINSYFGMATATEESVKARTGHGNEALTKYLNEALVIAKCN